MILALDIATRTGWAAGSSLDARPDAGVLDMSKAPGIGGKMAMLAEWMDSRISEWAPDLIIFEQPIHSVVRHGSSNVMRLAMGMCGAVEMAAHWHKVPAREVPISTWRKHFIGAGRAPKGERKDWCKVQVVHRCKVMGWGDLPHDAAEAAGIWHYGMTLRR